MANSRLRVLFDMPPGQKRRCAWCDDEFEVPEVGMVLWVNYGLDNDAGSLQVCSEGCAIAVQSADEAGYPVYRGRP